MAIQGSDDSDFCPLVEAPGSDVRKLLEADDPDPAGLLLARVKGDVERRHGIPLGTVENFGVRPKVACEYALVEHGGFLLSRRILGNSRISLNFQ